MNVILAFWPVLVFVLLEVLVCLGAIIHAYRKGWDDRGKAALGDVVRETRLKTQPVLK